MVHIILADKITINFLLMYLVFEFVNNGVEPRNNHIDLCVIELKPLNVILGMQYYESMQVVKEIIVNPFRNIHYSKSCHKSRKKSENLLLYLYQAV